MKIRMFNAVDNLKRYYYEERKWFKWQRVGVFIYKSASPMEAWDWLSTKYKDRLCNIELVTTDSNITMIKAKVTKK